MMWRKKSKFLTCFDGLEAASADNNTYHTSNSGVSEYVYESYRKLAAMSLPLLKTESKILSYLSFAKVTHRSSGFRN